MTATHFFNNETLRLHPPALRMVVMGDLAGIKALPDLGHAQRVRAQWRKTTPLVYAIELKQRPIFNWLAGQPDIWLDRISQVRLPLNLGYDKGTALDAAYQSDDPTFAQTLIDNGARRAIWPQHRARLQHDILRLKQAL